MALKSVYAPAPLIENNQIKITDEEHRHLHVARIEEGENVEVFDGNGNVWLAAVVKSGKRETVVEVREKFTVAPDPFEVTLALALIRPAAFELALEKVVEIGVTRIVPFIAARSNVPAARKNERLLRIVVEAAKQSKRRYLPTLEEPVGFAEVLRRDAASKIVFAERNGGSLHSALAGAPVIYLIGPEGGWTDSELSLAREHGFGLVSLGTTILKADTAAIVGAALIRHALASAE